ncbi:hydrogenase maturation protein [Neisseria sp. Ec49-e6-T10]|uniref:hydrogenase maturation protein n=1 Tax=Neisseria sp. Ec49-e6-T10 TaxID=3140744 RepID=UPI003EBE3E3E
MQELKIVVLSSAFNGLTQRAWLALQEAGHQVTFLLFTDEEAVVLAIEKAQPDLVICPFLKDRVPEVLWQNTQRPIVVIHPGIIGDRGASALDWAIVQQKDTWGVTALQTVEEMDAGPIWASDEFTMPCDPIRKSVLYNSKVSDSAIKCIYDVIDAFVLKKQPVPLNYNNPDVHGRLQPNMKQTDRQFSWTMAAKDILRVIHAAEGCPGVLTEIEGQSLYVYDAHLSRQNGEPGKILAKQDDAILVGTGEGSLWIGSLKRPKTAAQAETFKYPAVQVLGETIKHVPCISRSFIDIPSDEYGTIHYKECNQIGQLYFNFYNGAMSTAQCQRMCEALRAVKARPINILVIRGGVNAFSNGIHLNTIEVAEDSAQEAWLNINAINDVCLEILSAKQWVISAITGSAGAGGFMLALTADEVLARDGVVLNPHYATMGLYGSEYWTYTLPKKVGEQTALKLTTECLPVSTKNAVAIGLVDDVGPRDPQLFSQWLQEKAQLAQEQNKVQMKKMVDLEAAQQCRKKELAQMKLDMFEDRNNFSQLRRDFVLKKRAKVTPERLVATWAR